MKNSTIDWARVRRVLVVRLRSIGDTVLSTPSLIALKRFLPDASVDILLEDWVAPVLDGFTSIDEVLRVESSTRSRFAMARELRRRKYDVAFNIHGGPTATFFTYTSGAPHRVGYANYQFSFLYNHLLSSPSDFWKRDGLHSVEQQLALPGSVGVPVDDKLRTQLVVTSPAAESLERKLVKVAQTRLDQLEPFALIHPSAAFETKQWATDNFARVAEYLSDLGLSTLAVAAANETRLIEDLRSTSSAPIIAFNDLNLPEITALASRARLFVGNDSGIAHMAAAVNTPSVVIFGSSNRVHWRPWTDAPNEIVWESFACQPCPGHECKEFGDPKCIKAVTVASVVAAIERVRSKEKGGPQ